MDLPGMWEESDFTGGQDEERRLPVRQADAAQYARPAIPEEQRGQIRVRLLNATPDPLGSVAALIAQYSGQVVRSLAEVTDEQRRSALDDMGKTVLNGPLEAVQFHWQIEGVTRSITHQMVRSRASFFAQESLRFAVPEGDWAEEIPLPPSLANARAIHEEDQRRTRAGWGVPLEDMSPIMLLEWEQAMRNAQDSYQRLIEFGMPAEEARGVLPHDMPTRIHWVCDLRTLLADAGKRTCTQAQFPWRLIFAGMAQALRNRSHAPSGPHPRPELEDGWQFRLIADRLRPVCYQTGSCGFMAQFDRNCSIRPRVDANASIGRPSSEWGQEKDLGVQRPTDPDLVPWARKSDGHSVIPAIHDYEWAADPGAARS
jgi:flavin-dependent thymidylate synthase